MRPILAILVVVVVVVVAGLASLAVSTGPTGTTIRAAASKRSFSLPDSSGRFFWSYPTTEGETLSVVAKTGRQGVPDIVVFSLSCQEDGTLKVEAQQLMLSMDVPLPIDPTDYTRLALETGGLRLETPLRRKGDGYGSWATGAFEHGAAAAPGLMTGSVMVVRAVHRTPAIERKAREEDLSIAYPAPDPVRAATFLAHCAKVSGGAR